MTLTIKREIYEQMLTHCIEVFPYEACGILAGKDSVTDIYKIRNIEKSSVSYYMEPLEQLRAMKDIKTKGLNILAIYHSHPYGEPYPSQKDKELALYEVVYLIIGLKPEVIVKAFEIRDQIISEIAIEIV